MSDKINSENTYENIKRRLKEPIPVNLISYKKKGGNDKISYINVTDCKDLLDQRVGADAQWDAVIVGDSVVGDNYVVKVRIRIWAFDGTFEQDGIGLEKINLNSYGDPATNAYAKAFRRAAEGHGLARELWRDELSEEQLLLPATKQQIADLHTRAAQISRTEDALASHYTEKRTELFGEMTIAEATFALKDTFRFVKKEGAK